jgi:hypothetical protein
VRLGCQPNAPHRSDRYVCARCGVTVSNATYYGRKVWKHCLNGKGPTKKLSCGQRPVPIPAKQHNDKVSHAADIK